MRINKTNRGRLCLGCGYVGFCCQKEDRKYLIRSNQGREGVHYEEKMFISYSHEDSSKIKKFAFLLSLHGFDLWMDEKSLSSGDNYTTRILNGIHDSDIYLVFLSQASLKSTWVGAEIDFALREKIERGRLTIIPVLLEDVEIPVSLSNIDYLDARFSTQKAVEELSNRYQSEKIEHTDIVVSSVAFSISEETSVQGNVSSTTSTVLPTASTKTLLPSAQVNTAPEAQQPTRTTFKTSSGYGMIRSVYPLAFAKLSLDISGPKGGITENDVLIVPDSVSMFCDLDYEEASEEGAYDKCLRQINDITLSKVTEEVTKEDIDNARRDISNGQVEYMAAAYFEALDIYNESMTFKNNVVDPIVTADINDVQTAWIYVKEMNQALGTRINNLNRLWARNLGIETYFLYTQEGLKTPEE